LFSAISFAEDDGGPHDVSCDGPCQHYTFYSLLSFRSGSF